jgi:3-phenylpropionate/trans-cinnamate dioxygenase ferredoxin reductase subunit
MSRLTGWLNEPKNGSIPAQKPAPMPRGVATAGAGNR